MKRPRRLRGPGELPIEQPTKFELVIEWAAASGVNEASVLLDAACAALHELAGMAEPLDPPQLERFERARAALDEATRSRLTKAGKKLGYNEAIEQIRQCLHAGSHAGVNPP